MTAKEGYNYAPSSTRTEKVVQAGEFKFAAAFLDHGHIYGQCNGLLEAGAELAWVYDPDPGKLDAFLKQFPQAKPASDLRLILDDPEIRLVAAAAIPCRRGPIGIEIMESGKHYFTDKSPFTTLEQLEAARATLERSDQRYWVYYSERLHTEAGFYVTELIRQGAIGRVVQVLIMAPHRLSKHARPAWFFDKEQYGGILTDIGSHQFEQFLTYGGANDGEVRYARVANYNNPDTPGLEDFGEAALVLNNGTACYCRLDWFTPEGSPVWGDGRTFIVGTTGTLEVRKYWDPLQPGDPAGRIYLVNEEGPRLIQTEGKVGYPFFGAMIRDILDGTDEAMPQEHTFKAAELSMKAQLLADGNPPARTAHQKRENRF